MPPGFRHSSSGSRDNLLRDWSTGEEREGQSLDVAAAATAAAVQREGSIGYRGSREGSSGTGKECPPSPDQREGLVSPDIIRTVASTIQPSPRRRINNQGTYLSYVIKGYLCCFCVRYLYTFIDSSPNGH